MPQARHQPVSKAHPPFPPVPHPKAKVQQAATIRTWATTPVYSVTRPRQILAPFTTRLTMPTTTTPCHQSDARRDLSIATTIQQQPTKKGINLQYNKCALFYLLLYLLYQSVICNMLLIDYLISKLSVTTSF